MQIVHPLDRAWLTVGGTGARNYDEFADEAEITEIITANPASALAVEMPHLAPESVGRSFSDALPRAVERLAAAKQLGAYRRATDVVVLYRITSLTSVSYGLWAMVDTDQISTGADEPGLVIRNEEVFPEKVRERVALAEATGHLLSPVLLLQTTRGPDLHAALARACAEAGPPAATNKERNGPIHEIWPVPAGPLADQLCALAGGGELLVADGNHRSLAAQTGGLPRFLAVVTTTESVTIQPYYRLLTDVPSANLPAERIDDWPDMPPPTGTVYLYTRKDGFARLPLPATPGASLVDNLDHALVERVLLRDAYGLDPGDKRVVYVGGDYPPQWLCEEVEAFRAEVAVLIAPVRTEDFVAVNLARQKMPRKSTWFTPKARAGLVLAEL